MFQYIKDGCTVMIPKYWLLLTFLLCFRRLAKDGFSTPMHGIPICTILSLKFLPLNFRDGRDLRYHLSQPIVNLVLNNVVLSAL